VQINSIFIPPVLPDTLTVVAGGATSSCGGSFSIPIMVQHFDSIGSLQYSISWNPALLQLDSVGAMLSSLGVDAGDFNLMMVAGGNLAFSWTTSAIYGNTLPNNTALYRLYFKVLMYSGVGTAIQFTNSPSVQEAYSSAVLPSVEVPVHFTNSTITITDLIKPVITCPANVTQQVNSGANFATVTGLTAIATDNCGGAPTIGYVRVGASNSTATGATAAGTYNAGTTTVTYLATDAAGNTATCNTTVQINGIDPVILSLDSVNVACAAVGTIITVPIRVTQFAPVAGMTFNVNWDETKLSMTGITNPFPGYIPSNYAQWYQDTSAGDFHFLDGNAGGWPNIPDGGIFFSMTFKVLNTSGAASLNFYGAGSIPLEALDGNGDPLALAIKNGLVSFGDNVPPVLNGCPSSFTANTNPNSCNVTVILALPIASDDCGLSGPVISSHPSNDYNVGVNFINFSVTDNAGNTATCSMVITVEDKTGPILANCPSNTTVNTIAQCTQTVNLSTPTATDGCSGVFSVVSNHPSSTFSVGTATVVFTATDNAGNTSTCAAIVQVNDATPPVLVNCPAPVVIDAVTNECSQNVVIVGPTATDLCSGVFGISSNHPSSNYSAGITTVVYTATDDAGNTATCSMTVTVVEDVSPQLFNCPSNIVVSAPANQCAKVVTWSAPLATDGCGNTSFTLTSSINSGSIFLVGASNVIYTVTDNTNNSATCSFTVTVRDTTAPSIICPANLADAPQIGQCNVAVNWNNPVATDLCDNVLSITANHLTGDSFAANTTNIVTYVATDASGNSNSCSFEVKIIDLSPPVLNSCPQNVTVNVMNDSLLGCGARVNWLEPTLTGVCSQTGNFLISDANSGNFFPVGISTVKYKGFNQHGFYDSCQFTITVLDNAIMAFQSFPVSQIISLPVNKCDTAVTWLVPTFAGSPCNPPILTSNVADGSVLPIGTHLITYTLTDAAGSTITRSFSVQVVDEVAPVITNCPPNIPTNTGSGCTAIVTWPTITATDNCDMSVAILSAYNSGDAFPPGETTVRILAVDNGMNYDTCEFKVIVTGSSMPSIVNCPQNQLIVGCEGSATWIVPGVSGFCVPPVLTSTNISGDVFSIGVTTVVYTATSGNETATCSFKITVNENVAPSFTCPANITVDVAGRILSDVNSFVLGADHNAACNGVSLTFAPPTANDNCIGTPVITQTNGGVSGTEFTGTSSLVFKAVDISGNSALCTVKITVVDLPVLTVLIDPDPICQADFVTLAVTDSIIGATYDWTGPSQNYGNTALIMVAVSDGNAGNYTVLANINGCKTATTTTFVAIASKPDAVEDIAFKVKIGETLDMNVIENDVYNPEDYVVTLIGTPEGITYEGNGIFSYAGSTSTGPIDFLYKICSKLCPDKCDQAKVIINVNDTQCGFIPNLITPNSDGINDWLDIPCIELGDYPTNELTIYNQWGDKVYSAKPYTSKPSSAWYGTFNGKDLPDGVYYLIFKTKSDGDVYKQFIEIYR
jgi:gliding motility-associated-like protein